MHLGTAIRVDATKILSRRELAVVLDDLHRKAPRSRNTWLNLILVPTFTKTMFAASWFWQRESTAVAIGSSFVVDERIQTARRGERLATPL